ncbi:MAG TPA: ATP-dependent Clp protease adapter ClpS [Paenalcaligenes sp.]|nr:ATP-dependent Clp protease adapter ClpS [Paenalcaligenes sp.]
MATEIERDGSVVLEREKELAKPPMYQVVMLNDDYTPMDFVVSVLVQVFNKTPSEAERIMLKVHYKGRGICGVYPYDIAETRVETVHQLARSREHPLKCVMEPVLSDS